MKHAGSAALRQRQGDADEAHVVGFRPHVGACRSGPDPSAGRLKRGSAPRRVTAGRPVPRRRFSTTKSV